MSISSTELKIVAQETVNSLNVFRAKPPAKPEIVVMARGALADYKRHLIERFGVEFVEDEPGIVNEIRRRNRERKIELDRVKAKRTLEDMRASGF